MLSPATSPSTVGRADELAALQQAHAASLTGTPHGVVVAGEAGIGKTRLIDDFARGLPDDVAVARGQCVALGSVTPPFAPLRGVLRDLVARFGADTLLASSAPVARLLPALLPELADGPPAEVSQEQVHDTVSTLLEQLSLASPLAVIVEDVHWADVPSLDLLRSLLHTLRRGRVLMVLTYRTDELDRAHPLQPFLVELERARSVDHVALTRLTADEVREQARRIRPEMADRARIAALVERSDGIPFFVEELLGLEGAPEDPLPSTLRELVLARYARLSPTTQAMLRLVAAGGLRVEHRLVERVHAGDGAALDAAMREAIAAQVLVVDGSAYRFRHALIHEAVHGELLPGERARLHARCAEALEAGDEQQGRWAEIAGHWLEAHAQAPAFSALVAAAREAAAAGAPLVAAQLGERAIALWPRVDDAETRLGAPRSRLVLEVATAYVDAADERACSLLEEALAQVPAHDRLGRALLAHELIVARHDLGLAVDRDDFVEVLEQLPAGEDEPTAAVRARILTGLGIFRFMEVSPEARATLEEATAYSRALLERAADPDAAETARFELARGLTNLGSARALEGDVDGAFADLAEALEVARGDPQARMRYAEQAAWLLLFLGRFAEAAEAAAGARDPSRSLGNERGWGALIAILGAHALVASGDLQAAREIAHRVRSARPALLTAGYCAVLEAELGVLGDDLASAERALADAEEAIREVFAEDQLDDLWAAHIMAEVAMSTGDADAAWRHVERLWAWPRAMPGPAFALAALGAGALAELRRAHREPTGTTSADAEARLRALFESVAVWEVATDWRALIDAELSGEGGDASDPEAWRVAVDAAALGRLPVATRARALQRLAEALLADGDREEAAHAIAQSLALAERHGLARAARLAAELSRRAGLAPAPATSTRGRSGTELTQREQQVLALIAEGLTNRQIGERLFISDKTASVHVSAILRKIGAATRAEAAARAAALLA